MKELKEDEMRPSDHLSVTPNLSLSVHFNFIITQKKLICEINWLHTIGLAACHLSADNVIYLQFQVVKTISMDFCLHSVLTEEKEFVGGWVGGIGVEGLL